MSAADLSPDHPQLVLSKRATRNGTDDIPEVRAGVERVRVVIIVVSTFPTAARGCASLILLSQALERRVEERIPIRRVLRQQPKRRVSRAHHGHRTPRYHSVPIAGQPPARPQRLQLLEDAGPRRRPVRLDVHQEYQGLLGVDVEDAAARFVVEGRLRVHESQYVD